MVNPPARRSATGERIAFLDGLRCVAILGVLAFHYFPRYAPPNQPVTYFHYGELQNLFAVFNYGRYGVELFFIISGFVIAMTLQKCASVGEFAARRYARLAPAMLVCSVVTLIAMQLIPQSPFQVHPVSFLSSVTFIDPYLFNRVFRTDLFDSIDGSYWSLYVEAKFYILAAVLFFLRRERFIAGLAAVATLAAVGQLVHIPVVSFLLHDFLIADYLPWFLIGVAFHAQQQRVPTRQWAGTIAWSIALLLALAWKAGSATLVGVALVVPSLFALAMYQPLLRRVLSRPGITAVGIASYSLYLLHNHIGAAVLHALPASFWEQPWRAAAVAFAMMPVLCALSVVSYRYIETPLNRWTLSQLMTRLVSRPPPAAPVVTRG